MASYSYKITLAIWITRILFNFCYHMMSLAYFILYTTATHSCFNLTFLELNCTINMFFFSQNLRTYYYAVPYCIKFSRNLFSRTSIYKSFAGIYFRGRPVQKKFAWIYFRGSQISEHFTGYFFPDCIIFLE